MLLFITTHPLVIEGLIKGNIIPYPPSGLHIDPPLQYAMEPVFAQLLARAGERIGLGSKGPLAQNLLMHLTLV